MTGLPDTPEEMHALLLSGELDEALELGSLVHQIHQPQCACGCGQTGVVLLPCGWCHFRIGSGDECHPHPECVETYIGPPRTQEEIDRG